VDNIKMGFKETKCVWSRIMLFITGITGLNFKCCNTAGFWH